MSTGLRDAILTALTCFILCCRLAYDGKGNAVVREERNAAAAVESLGDYGQGLYAERWAPYVKVSAPASDACDSTSKV